MASTTCGYCGRLAHMTAASGLHLIASENGRGTLRQAAYKCPNCKRLNLATEFWVGESIDAVADKSAAEGVDWDEPKWLPNRAEARQFPDVPAHIADAAAEATRCLSFGAYRAVGALARAVIEATAKDKGATGTTLAQRIEALQKADHVRKHTAEQAHEIRHFGNDMAHGDFVDPVEKAEAEEVVGLMVEVLDEVYQSPARLQARKDARLARKAKG